MNTSTLQVLITAAALFAARATALSEDAIHAPAPKTIGVAKPQIVTSLIVMNARGATLDGGKLRLMQNSRSPRGALSSVPLTAHYRQAS